MLDLKQASQIAGKLRDSFGDVTVYGAKEPITVVARKQNFFIPLHKRQCSHTRIRRARNITGRIETIRGKKYMVSPGKHQAYEYDYVVDCVDCDEVLAHQAKTADKLFDMDEAKLAALVEQFVKREVVAT